MGAVSPLIYVPEADEIPPELQASKADATIRLELPKIRLDCLPAVVGYRLLVLPVSPPTATEGGIALAAESVRNLNILRTTGVIVAVGPLAFAPERGWPRGYREDLDLASAEKWVSFSAHAGQEVLMRAEDGRSMVALRYLNDADVLGIFDSAEQAAEFLVLV